MNDDCENLLRYYLRRRLASECIVPLGVTLSRCVCARRAAYITYRLQAAKVMRCIQHSLVVYMCVMSNIYKILEAYYHTNIKLYVRYGFHEFQWQPDSRCLLCSVQI